ncbi:MAG: hypothetical protein ACYDH9_04005 [Limisphaerales bacterium]
MAIAAGGKIHARGWADGPNADPSGLANPAVELTNYFFFRLDLAFLADFLAAFLAGI